MGGVTNALGQLGESTGLSTLGQGVYDLFGGGGDTALPADFVGPPSPYQAPNFLQGFTQGLLGRDANVGVDVPTAGGQTGAGLGQLLNFLERIRQQSGGGVPTSVYNPGGRGPGGLVMLPGYSQAQAPSGGLVHGLIGAYTGGILGGGIPSGRQV